MALTYSNEVELLSTSRHTGEVQRVIAVTATFDDSYPTGGETITPADIDGGAEGALTAIDHVVVSSFRPAGTEQVLWDRANEKLLVFTADGTQATGASDQSAVFAELLVFGR